MDKIREEHCVHFVKCSWASNSWKISALFAEYLCLRWRVFLFIYLLFFANIYVRMYVCVHLCVQLHISLQSIRTRNCNLFALFNFVPFSCVAAMRLKLHKKKRRFT